MIRYLICTGAEIKSYGEAPAEVVSAISSSLAAGDALHELPPGADPDISDETHEWDTDTETAILKE